MSTSRPRQHVPGPSLGRLASVVLMVGCSSTASRQDVDARNDEMRANRIERSLLPAARVAGRTYPPTTIPQRLQDYGIPAVSIAVVDSGRIVWARAYGLRDVGASDSVTTATLFQAASMSKPVASTAALQLVQEGKLTLDGPVNARLTAWRIPENELTAKTPVTLRHLLTHTGGLTVHGFLGYSSDRQVPTTVQVLDGGTPANSRPVRVDTVPGSRWRYSGGGMTVMQLLISEVADKEFPAVMRERVLDPAGMRASTFEQPLPQLRAREAATGYRANRAPVVGRYHTYPEMAAAGLWTTPTDLARWMLDIQRSLRGERGVLLSPRMAQAMVTPGMGEWGLGVGTSGTGTSARFEHGGANEGFRGQFVGYVSQPRGAVVMTNSDVGGRIVSEIMVAIAKEYGWPGFQPRLITPAPLTDEARRAFAGRYENASGFWARLTVDDSSMWLERSNGQRAEMIFVGEGRLDSPTMPSVRFERSADGRPNVLLFGGDRFVRKE